MAFEKDVDKIVENNNGESCFDSETNSWNPERASELYNRYLTPNTGVMIMSSNDNNPDIVEDSRKFMNEVSERGLQIGKCMSAYRTAVDMKIPLEIIKMLLRSGADPEEIITSGSITQAMMNLNGRKFADILENGKNRI